MTEIPQEGDMPKIEWEPDVPLLHRKLVGSGLFDTIKQEEPFQTGEVVVSRYSDKIYQVYEEQGENVVIGYDTDEGSVRKTLPKRDVKNINGYAQYMYQMAQPTTEIQIDKDGHAQIKYHRPNSPKPPSPGGTSDRRN